MRGYFQKTGRSGFAALLALLFFLGPCCIWSASEPATLPGIDVLLNKHINLLSGKRVGLITNHTGVNRNLRSTIGLLHGHPGVNLVALFAPEHGIKGIVQAGKDVDLSEDALTGLTVYSLYGATRRPTQEMLSGLDVLVFDIQDIGTRWYTYISTMALAMEEAARHGKEFIVLDRPNPLGGARMEGPVLQDTGSFVGMYRIPVVHGMTVGELALFYKDEHNLKLNLQIVKMEGWKRTMLWEDTGLSWVATSPNIPSFESALSYPGLGLCGEVGVVSVGVGQELPFQVFCAPWLSAEAFSGLMNGKNLPGVYFEPFQNVPETGRFRGQACSGVRIKVLEKEAHKPLETGLIMLEALSELHPDRVARGFNKNRQRSFNLHLGTSKIAEHLLKGARLEPVIRTWDEDLALFSVKRAKYLLY